MPQSSKIAKNTLIMYVRMFVMLLIGLYTSRVVLNTLGVSNYGIYNVVGGVVGMFSIISSSLSSSISRYVTFEIGHGDLERLKDIFSSSLMAQVAMAVAMFVLMEIVGVWFLNYKMNIPVERLGAANVVMHCSIVSFVLGLLNTPFSAEIIAYEHFGIFAYLTLAESIMKLLVVFLLGISPYDKLETYAFLLLMVTIIIQCFYLLYCRKHFAECRTLKKFNKSLFKEMTGFAGWSFFGNASWTLNSQGVDILINLFFGVTLNAARGIANQVNSIVQGFVSNFMVTMNPQITKSYAQGDYEYLHKLVFSGAKYSFFLMLLFSLPICLETKQILTLWLKTVPNYAVIFVRLTLISAMISVWGTTLTTAQSSTGKMKKMAIGTSLITFLEFPFVYVCFKLGMSAVSCYMVHIIVYLVLQFVKVHIVKDYIHITYGSFMEAVMLRVVAVVACSLPLPVLVCHLMSESIFRLLTVTFVSALSTAACVYYVGMKESERGYVTSYIKNKFRK